jgi:ubiquinone/menaquinone biosynthesis C-methylase UbiE
MDSLLEQFLPYLRCPITRLPLQPVAPAQLAPLNARIERQELRHTDGSVVPEPLIEALRSEDGQYIYPIVDHQIVVLLESLAIVADSEDTALQALDAQKKIVLDFYNEFGWKKDGDNLFKDTVTFEDRRDTVARYWSQCHLRLNRYLPNGHYILDVASGAIPNDEYLTYSDNFRVRICMDFSLLAMQEAVQRLNGRGIFILGDMTNLPMADRCLDAVISLHTVYHIPRAEQTRAVGEAYRVLRPGGKAVIVYSWKDAPLMYYSMRAWRRLMNSVRRRKRQPRDMVGAPAAGAPAHPELFIAQQKYNWYARELRQPFRAQLKVYSALSRSFSNTFLREKTFGKQVAGLIFRLESWLPGFFGRFGQYPTFVLNKPTDEKETVAA